VPERRQTPPRKGVRKLAMLAVAAGLLPFAAPHAANAQSAAPEPEAEGGVEDGFSPDAENPLPGGDGSPAPAGEAPGPAEPPPTTGPEEGGSEAPLEPGPTEEVLETPPAEPTPATPPPESTPPAPQAAPAPPPPVAPTPPPAAPAQPTPTATPAQPLQAPEPVRANQAGTRVEALDAPVSVRRAPAAPVEVRAPRVRSQPQPEARVPIVQTSKPAAPAKPAAAKPEADSHVVQAGQSLWSIAQQRLGQGASAAAVAAEVDRLWRLNADRIGTGDPSLLPAGTELKLN